MNGRCETDPFDQAINVCGMCYGEFCQSCLVMVRGRKHPLCKECAIVSAGLRAGGKAAVRGSRKTANARRQALAEAPRQDSFQFYEPATPLGVETAAPPNGLPDGPSKDESLKRRAEDTAAAPEAEDQITVESPIDDAEHGGKKSRKGVRGRSKAKKAAEDEDEVEETIDIDSRLGGIPASNPKPAVADDTDEYSTTASTPTGQSAVDQLDLIRAEHASDDEDGPFRKPRPFLEDLAGNDPGRSNDPAATSSFVTVGDDGDDRSSVEARRDRRNQKERRSAATAPEPKRPKTPVLEDYDDSGTAVAPVQDGEELPTLPRRRETNLNHVRKPPKPQRPPKPRADEPTTAGGPDTRTSPDGATNATAESSSFDRLNDPFEPPAWTQQDRRQRQRRSGDRKDSDE